MSCILLISGICTCVASATQSGLSIRVVATDAKTKEPIKSLTVIPAFREQQTAPLTWQSQYLKRYTGGPAEFRVERPWPETILRIESDGYRPFVTRPIQRDEREVVLQIALETDTGLAGKVLMPDGTPAYRASVMVCTRTNEVTIQGGKLGYDGHGQKLGKLVETAADGTFHAATEIDPWVLVVAHESGYAEATAAEFAKSSTVRLKPWGRIEGQFVLGGKAVADQAISVGAGRGDVDVMLHYSDNATTDADGRFVVERVPPVKLFIQPVFKQGNSTFALFWFSGYTSVVPGKTIHVTVPRPGRPLIGRVSLPPNTELRLADFAIDAEVFLRPPSVSGMQEMVKQQHGAYEAFMKSKYAQGFRPDRIAVAGDGTFRIEGLPEAEYVLQVRARPKVVSSPANRGETSAFAAMRVKVPPLADSKDPVELGNLVLRLQ